MLRLLLLLLMCFVCMMATFTEDLDYFDETVFDPSVKPVKKDFLSVTLKPKSGFELSDDLLFSERMQLNDKEDENDEKEREEEERENEKAENEKEWEGENDRQEVIPEKVDKATSDQFTTELWSEKGSTIVSPKSRDSWDLPVGPIPWDDNDRPIERLLSYADLTLTEEEEGGLLTDRIVAACSTYLTESPGNKCHVVAKLTLNNKNLNDIRILCRHRFLQYIDLSWNNLTDLTPLGSVPYLMYLDVSHNLLQTVLCFKPPVNLTYVNYSYNQVWQIRDLSNFWSLSYLDLSHNKISKIQGLENLRYLRHLDLSYNQIEEFENLNHLRITDLNLEYNIISKFHAGMNTMPHLTNLYLNNNLISSLKFLEGVYHLKKLELQGNNITDLVELSNLKHLKNLRHLDLSGNPVSEKKPYRALILNFLQDLTFIDQTEVDISERVATCKKNRFNIQLEAAKNNARMILLEQLNDTCLDLDVLPVDQGPYPFVILVGPSASSKKAIACALAEKYPDKIYIGKLHTTREILEPEKKIFVHISQEDFNDSIKAGKFLCVTENLGQLYGFSREELGTAIKEHKLCLTSMDMMGALTIHAYGIRPFLILAILKSKEEHTNRLKMTYGPIIHSVGCTYVAQRQLLDNHASNVKRIEQILNDIVEEATNRGEWNTIFVCPESCNSLSSDTSFKKSSFDVSGNTSNPIWGYSVTTDNIVGTSDTGYPISYGNSDLMPYVKKKPCGYACKPSECLYQKKLPEVDIAAYSTCGDSKVDRLTASEASVKVVSSTSYSALLTPPLLVDFAQDLPSQEVTFSDWTMPFIDWSTFNLTGLQLEEAAELLCEKYIESVMSTRDVYESLHLENPGLFSLCVFTDKTSEAVKTISKFLKQTWRSTPNRKPIHDVENDLIHKAYVPRKLEKLKEMLRNDFLSADGDGCPKNINMGPFNSPSTICAEMRMKGYGDSTENLET